jgi:hypothetical protein
LPKTLATIAENQQTPKLGRNSSEEIICFQLLDEGKQIAAYPRTERAG